LCLLLQGLHLLASSSLLASARKDGLTFNGKKPAMVDEDELELR